MDVQKLINEIIDREKQQRGITSDAELARELGLSHNAIPRWRQGKVHPKTFTLVLLLHQQAQTPRELRTAA